MAGIDGVTYPELKKLLTQLIEKYGGDAPLFEVMDNEENEAGGIPIEGSKQIKIDFDNICSGQSPNVFSEMFSG